MNAYSVVTNLIPTRVTILQKKIRQDGSGPVSVPAETGAAERQAGKGP